MPRLVFANQLRGLAALLVVLSHWGGVYWGMPELVSQYTASPIVQTPAPLLYYIISINPDFGLGPLGVALFFLISGLVIPYSLAKLNPWEFLFARALRILPSFWFAWCFLVLLLLLAHHYWQRPFPWSNEVLVSNLLLIPDLFQHPSIDIVSWTLIIEIKFYLIAAFCRQAFLQAKLLPLLGVSAGCLLLNLGYDAILQHFPNYAPLLTSTFQAAVFIPFMLIGSLMHFYLERKITVRQLVLCALFLGTCFLLAWRFGPMREQFPVVPKIYLTGFVLFSVALYFRDQFKANKLLDLLADLSYPLYLLHAIPGYMLCTWLLERQWPYLVILATQFACFLSLAWLVHTRIEQPCLRWSKRIIASQRQRIVAY